MPVLREPTSQNFWGKQKCLPDQPPGNSGPTMPRPRYPDFSNPMLLEDLYGVRSEVEKLPPVSWKPPSAWRSKPPPQTASDTQDLQSSDNLLKTLKLLSSATFWDGSVQLPIGEFLKALYISDTGMYIQNGCSFHLMNPTT